MLTYLLNKILFKKKRKKRPATKPVQYIKANTSGIHADDILNNPVYVRNNENY